MAVCRNEVEMTDHNENPLDRLITLADEYEAQLGHLHTASLPPLATFHAYDPEAISIHANASELAHAVAHFDDFIHSGHGEEVLREWKDSVGAVLQKLNLEF
tara:strand:+ start:278 stop:583 length:306 start_codon:yes stop_codon:yes gene_type:complete